MNKDKSIRVPISNYLKMKFQKHCQQRDTSMAEQIRYLIRKETDKDHE